MVNFTIEEIRQLMDNPESIRNISIISEVDHGKSTLSDALISKAGIFCKKEKYYHDYCYDQKQCGVTIQSSKSIALFYKYQTKYLFNLIDTKCYNETSPILKITDGALVLVDNVQGFSTKAETMLRQALMERIKPVLMINKIDRSILQHQLDSEEIYNSFVKIIDKVNDVISTYQSKDIGVRLDPTEGNVAFGTGKFRMAFTLNKFAQIYSSKFNIDKEKMIKKLWGDNFFDLKEKKWTTSKLNNENQKPLQRSFGQFIMDPMSKLFRSLIGGNKQQYQKYLQRISVKLSQEEQNLKGKQLLKVVLNKWLPVDQCLLQMTILHLPSPKTAQKSRTQYMYQGPNDNCSTSMRNCDPSGPLMIYICKMVPSGDKGRFYAFGRVFSGTVATGQKVRIMTPNYKPGKKDEVFEKAIQRTILIIARKSENVPDVPCGNIVWLSGIDSCLNKTGTITDIDHPEAYPIRSMKQSVSPVIKVIVQPKLPADLPKLLEGLKKLSKTDPLVVCKVEDTGQNVISCCSELHLQICMKQLQNEYARCQLIRSDPFIIYKETLTQRSSGIAMTRSPNKHNILHGSSEPLTQKLSLLIDSRSISEHQNKAQREKLLVEQFQWESEHTSKIWCFGPENSGPNLIVDATKGIQYINEIKQSMISSFQWSSQQGVLCQENMRGVRININDCVLHADSIHRGAGQIMPTARRLYLGLQILGRPTLMQPIFMCTITVPIDSIKGAYTTLNKRRGIIIQQNQISGTIIRQIKAYLPVDESLGFTAQLRQQTEGKAFSQLQFDHWELINGLPYEDPKAEEIVRAIRKRKGLKQQLPDLGNYLDNM